MASKGGAASAPQLEALLAEMHALNSKIQVIAQRMKIIEKNEQIIGKTLITHSKYIKELQALVGRLEEGGVTLAEPSVSEEESPAVQATGGINQQVEANRNEIEQIKADLKEIKYVLETFNPVAYVTFEQVADIINEKVGELKKKSP